MEQGVAGLGFAGLPAEDELGEVERAFAGRGVPVQVELSNLADPAVGDLLTGRGYRLVSYENVLARPVTGDVEPVRPPGVEVRPSGQEELDTWLEVVLDAATHPETEGLPSPEASPRRIVENAERDLSAAGARRYLAPVDGVPASGASMHTVQPGSRSQRNVQRRGFDLLYTRAVLVR